MTGAAIMAWAQSARVYVEFASFAAITERADAFEVVDAVETASPDARLRSTIVHIDATRQACEAWHAFTLKAIDAIVALCSIMTRISSALVDILFTRGTRISSSALAVEGPHGLHANATIATGRRSALLNVSVTVNTTIPGGAKAVIAIHQVDTITTYAGIRLTLLVFDFAQPPTEARLAGACEVCHAVYTHSIVLA